MEIKYSYTKNNADSSFCLNINRFEIDINEIVFLHGDSGCGKTTLLNILAGVIKLNITMDIRKRFPEIAYVMHSSTLPPWGCLYECISIEEKLRNKYIDHEKFSNLCQEFKLPENILNYKSWQLSLGMRQRIEIAKAVAFSPNLILLDEAFSGIDKNTKPIVLKKLLDWVQSKKGNIIGTAHQLDDLLRLAQKIIWLKNGEIHKIVKINETIEERLSMNIESLLSLEASKIITYG